MNNHQDIAYYYPAPYWSVRESSWVKSLLLFFDEVAILLPRYMHGRHQAADPTLVEPLEDRGLLRVLEPNDWIDEKMANQLAEIIVELLTNGTFDDLPKEKYFHALSQSRLGYGADVGLADFLVDELTARDLARPSEDGVSIPLHPTVRTTILVILGQLSRAAGNSRGFAIHPTTNDRHAIDDLIATLSRDRMPSCNKVTLLDLEPVSLNMGSVPLDELLQFRTEHQDAHKTYMQNLQRFMAELASIDVLEDREALLLNRRQEIADAAHDMRRFTLQAFRKNLPSWSLGLAGGAWSLGTGDPIGAALAAVGLLGAELFGKSRTVTAYSYLFSMQQRYGA